MYTCPCWFRFVYKKGLYKIKITVNIYSISKGKECKSSFCEQKVYNSYIRSFQKVTSRNRFFSFSFINLIFFATEIFLALHFFFSNSSIWYCEIFDSDNYSSNDDYTSDIEKIERRASSYQVVQTSEFIVEWSDVL